jgi:hypothetical protein
VYIKIGGREIGNGIIVYGIFNTISFLLIVAFLVRVMAIKSSGFKFEFIGRMFNFIDCTIFVSS